MTAPPARQGDAARARDSAEVPPDMPPSDNDMLDTAAEIAFWAPLPVAACAPINERFATADRDALRSQRWHRVFTLAATLSGGGALLIGVWNLDFGIPHANPAATELALVLLLVVSIAIGTLQQRKNRWLLNRHKAELLRLVKFEFITTPSVWDGRGAGAAQWVTDRVGEIDAVRDRRALRQAVATARLPEELTLPPDIASPTLLKLVEYYLAKRLNPQKEYLANRAQRNGFWDGALQRNVNTMLFFASVAAIATQAAFVVRGAPNARQLVTVITLCAASLPVVASMSRTLRSAFEFSRNRSRFLAAHDALSTLEHRLTHHVMWARTTELAPDAKATVLREFERCETQLRTEHNEWLRLMLEAEWFG